MSTERLSEAQALEVLELACKEPAGAFADWLSCLRMQMSSACNGGRLRVRLASRRTAERWFFRSVLAAAHIKRADEVLGAAQYYKAQSLTSAFGLSQQVGKRG